jgi:hypothetical protein
MNTSTGIDGGTGSLWFGPYPMVGSIRQCTSTALQCSRLLSLGVKLSAQRAVFVHNVVKLPSLDHVIALHRFSESAPCRRVRVEVLGTGVPRRVLPHQWLPQELNRVDAEGSLELFHGLSNPEEVARESFPNPPMILCLFSYILRRTSFGQFQGGNVCFSGIQLWLRYSESLRSSDCYNAAFQTVAAAIPQPRSRRIPLRRLSHS